MGRSSSAFRSYRSANYAQIEREHEKQAKAARGPVEPEHIDEPQEEPGAEPDCGA